MQAVNRYDGRSHFLIALSAVWLMFPCLGNAAQGGSTVFPGTQGFGIETPAGRGGRVIRVTNLNNAGPGSLWEALQVKGPRIVVFEVGGVIDFMGKIRSIDESYLTVAGQTAPAPGITIIRGGFGISGHDILIQHLRIRLGDGGDLSGTPPGSDCLGLGAGAHNVVIDHCSLSWGTDEVLSINSSLDEKDPPHDITISNCIIAEGLNNSNNPKGAHSCGSLFGGRLSHLAIIGNLYASNDRRNPYSASNSAVMANNVIFNPVCYAIELGPYPETTGLPPSVSSVVSNVLIRGADTVDGVRLIAAHSTAEAYLEENVETTRYIPASFSASDGSGTLLVLDHKPVWPEGFMPLSAAEVVRHVMRCAGARPLDRDEVDERIVRQVKDGSERIIDSQEQVGGYPRVAMTRGSAVPDRGIESWIAAAGLAVTGPDLNSDPNEMTVGFEKGFTGLSWSFEGSADWEISTSDHHSGSYSAQAGVIDDGQTSALRVSFLSWGGTIRFHVKTSSELGGDKLVFKVDGRPLGEWSGSTDWRQVNYPVPPGRHLFDWSYTKDDSYAEGQDTAWLDDITFPAPADEQPPFDVVALPETAGVLPTGTDKAGKVSATEDPVGPFHGVPVHFQGIWTSPRQEQIGDSSLIYRYRIEFYETVRIGTIIVCGTSFNGADAAIRLLDEHRRVVAERKTGKPLPFHTLNARGVVGRCFYLEEFDGSTKWRYRERIVLDYAAVP
jgi:hypothetical protein